MKLFRHGAVGCERAGALDNRGAKRDATRGGHLMGLHHGIRVLPVVKYTPVPSPASAFHTPPPFDPSPYFLPVP